MYNPKWGKKPKKFKYFAIKAKILPNAGSMTSANSQGPTMF